MGVKRKEGRVVTVLWEMKVMCEQAPKTGPGLSRQHKTHTANRLL